MTTDRIRKSGLTTLELHVLDVACRPVWEAFGGTYLVGTAQTRGSFRDVDVRTILSDDEFDRLFGALGGRAAWGLFCLSIGLMLAQQTGLPVDYQIQRRTEANEKYDGPRNPLGMGNRVYAGGGDATRFAEEAP